MNEPTFRERVVAAVKAKLGNEPWFKGVCVDTIDDYTESEFEDAVESCRAETLYWDAPNSGF